MSESLKKLPVVRNLMSVARSGMRRVERASDYARSLTGGRLPEHRFVVFAQGRTGSTLLASLLSAHPQVFCDREILSTTALFPRRVIHGRALRHAGSAYGFKLKVYHLTLRQKLADPRPFVERLHGEGWRIIYLYRANLLRQVVSLRVADRRATYHLRKGEAGPDLSGLTVDCRKLIGDMGWRKDRLAEEERVLEGLEHLTLNYEADLVDGARHQDTLDRAFDFLGVPHARVNTEHRRITPPALSDFIANYDEVAEAVTRAGYGHFL
ncbi:MAG: hypothetical protein ACE5FN_01350 [Leptospirillia bacterium]